MHIKRFTAANMTIGWVHYHAIQIHGGAGLNQDTLLPSFYMQARSLRLADGPDEVHKAMIARIELAKRGYAKKR